MSIKNYANIETLRSFLDNLKNAFAAISHKHAVSDITDLQSSLNELSDSTKAYTDNAVDGLATETYVNTQVANLVNSAPDKLNTLDELAAALGDDENFAVTVTNQIASKVDKVEGKGLSTNDYTTVEKTKLAGIATGAEVNVQSDWAETDTGSDAYIKNKPYIKAGAGTNSILVGEISTNTAAGDYAYAGGRESVASGVNSHAEGYKATASGSFAYAQGRMTTASGYASHAEGTEAVAKGYASHAEGMGTIAGSSYQHVQGLYNIEDTTATYLHIVGNGGGSSLRSNAHTLDKDGNAWFAGDVYVGGTNQASGEKLVKQSELPITYTQSEVDALIAAVKTFCLPKVASITLSENSWNFSSNYYYQDVPLGCCTPTSKVDLQPTYAQLATWQDDGLAFTTQSKDGIVRVWAIPDAPREDITVQVTVQEVLEV